MVTEEQLRNCREMVENWTEMVVGKNSLMNHIPHQGPTVLC
jgi:hypothetical protein